MALNILLVEDEPVSAQFLLAALAPLARVRHAGSVAAAAVALDADSFGLLLVDARLPDGDALDVLSAARRSRRNPATPALALTAEPDAATRARLADAGFLECLGKPISADALRGRIRRHLPCSAAPVWDDAAAARALGSDAAAIAALRGLLRADLATQRQRIVAAFEVDDRGVLREELHRLRAACAFCGAAALSAAIETLQAGHDPAALARFEQACAELLA